MTPNNICCHSCHIITIITSGCPCPVELWNCRELQRIAENVCPPLITMSNELYAELQRTPGNCRELPIITMSCGTAENTPSLLIAALFKNPDSYHNCIFPFNHTGAISKQHTMVV